MTSVMVDVDADVVVMTLVGDPVARGASEHMAQSSPKLLSVRGGSDEADSFLAT